MAREQAERKVEAIGALIPTVLRHVEREHGALAMVRREWRKAVGSRLAAHAKPVSLRRGRLVVCVDGPGDGFALSYERARLLERLRAATGGHIDELVIRPGSAPR